VKACTLQINITLATPAQVLSIEDLTKELKEVVGSQHLAFSVQSE
jgi:hypothetical protein